MTAILAALPLLLAVAGYGAVLAWALYRASVREGWHGPCGGRSL